MSLADYLSKNYADSSKDKKKKKKDKSKREKEMSPSLVDSTSLIIDTGEMIDEPLSESEEGPVIIKTKSTEKKGGWINVSTKEEDSSIVEKSLDQKNETPLPTTNKKIMMNDGSFAGLQTSDSLQKSLSNQRQKFQRELAETNKSYDHTSTSTVYRDASGRKLSQSEVMSVEQRDEMIAKKMKERERQIRELNRSEADVISNLKSKERLAKVSGERLNVYETDEIYNQTMKDQLKEDDPMLIYNPKAAKSLERGKFTSVTGRKLYQGSYPENRFGVMPGYRWDGIDRSNGYEKKRFEKLNQVQERKVLNYTLSEDL